MSTARLIEDYLTSASQENENTMMTDFWLEFVAARDDRGISPEESFPDPDLKSRLQEFSERIGTLVCNQARLHEALKSEFPVPTSVRFVESPKTAKPSQVPAEVAKRLPKIRENLYTEPHRLEELGIFLRGRLHVSNWVRNSFLFDVFEKLT